MLPEFSRVRERLKKTQADFLQDAIRYYSGRLFADIPRKIMPEGDALAQHYNNDISHEPAINKIEVTDTINIDDVKNNPGLIYKHLLQLAKKFADAQTVMTFQTINEVTTLVGNVHETKGPMQPEDILAMYDKVEIPFTDDGQPVLPVMVAGEKMYAQMMEAFEKMKADVQFEIKFKEIIDRKREAWYDRKANRKLVD